nr:DUF397 domain-containing protein [Kibdelosporangium sp. MJ126-NF4]CEL16170.1 hypothetical protein [Kibdelosporangium sp. MJ126-NF4]CTQ94095.1 hypothetical protein [Kibdelosporangium sp. MJ126-NF4]
MDHLTWRKSSYSGGHGGDTACVEVAHTSPTAFVRDSKNPSAPHLTFPSPLWSEFLRTVR